MDLEGPMTYTKSLKYDSGSSELRIEVGTSKYSARKRTSGLKDFLMCKFKVLFFFLQQSII